MKVFVVDPSLFTLPYDQAFCRGLAGAGAEVTLIGRPLRPEERLIEGGFAFSPLFYPKAEAASRREAAGKALKGLEHARGLAALGRLVRRQRPDIVHVQWLVVPLLDRWGYARVSRLAPLVFTAHNSVPLHGSAAALQRFGHHAAVRRFARYIAHTEQTAAHLAELGIERARITVLAHPPLELPCGRPEQAEIAAGGPLRVLLFGALKPYKGVDVLVRAALGLARRGRDFRVVIAGKPFFPLDGLRAEIAAAGAESRFDFDLRFLPDDDLAATLAAADIVVFPYREVDASGALALAASFGKPIVASAVGVFAEPPMSGLLRLVPPGDALALAAALEELIDVPAARAAAAARSRDMAAGMLGWPAFASACLEIYRGLPKPG